MWSLVTSNRRQPHRSLVGFGYGVHQRIIGHRLLFGLGYGAQKRVLGHMVLLWMEYFYKELIMRFIRSRPYVLEFTRGYKGSILMGFMNWYNIFFLMIWSRRLIIYLNYNFIHILFLHNIGIKEEARGFSMGSYMVFGRIMNHKRRLEIRNLLLARDHSNILFHHGTHKCFLRRFQGNLLWD